jgi:hypothetical protein
MPNFLVLVIVIIILLALLPTWPYSREWGYYPFGGSLLGLIILLAVLRFCGLL